jgi:hypothetical protein
MLNLLDYDIDDEDDFDESDEGDNGQFPELGLPTHSGGCGMRFSFLNFLSSLTLPLDMHTKVTPPIAVFEKVQQWDLNQYPDICKVNEIGGHKLSKRLGRAYVSL